MRLLAPLLLLLSPGLGGWAVGVLHPCPAEAAHAAAHGVNDCTPHPDQGECHCFGTCNATATFQPATASIIAAPIPTFTLIVPRSAEPARPGARHLTLLLPPATAPPVLY